jgi:hypothetical protein
MRVGLALLGLFAWSPFGCDEQPPILEEAPEELPLTAGAARARSCVVPAPAGVEALVAGDAGVVFAVRAAGGEDPALRVLRARGEGCELVVDEDTPIAAGALLDVDERGNIYVFPAEAPDPGVVSTMLPGEYPESMVARVDPANRVAKLLPAGRGIWGFGVAPEGDALWVSACGPSGIFALTVEGVTPSLEPAQLPGVLSDAWTFWSVGVRTCEPTEALTPACGFALVRTTPAGSEELGTTIVDLGAGFEQATLARCGANVCGWVAGGVIVWGAGGEPLRTITAEDALARPGERVAQVSGNARGIYVLLRGERGARVVFVPR